MKHIRNIGVAIVALSFLGACSSSDSSSGGSDGSAPLFGLNRNDSGQAMRFDGCSGPIRILLNPGNLKDVTTEFTDVDVVAQLGELFTEYAKELSDATGFDIQYGGTTDLALSDTLTENHVIIFNFGDKGFPGREDAGFERVFVFGKTKDDWVQIRSVQYFEDSEGYVVHYDPMLNGTGAGRDVGIDEAGKRSLKTALGEALGLRELIEDDMVLAGVAPKDHGKQVMYTDSHIEDDGKYNLEWGKGDKAGLKAVGADNACF